MARISPLRGVRFNPEHINLGTVLAPPYDVISNDQREALYAQDLRNIVRIDYCRNEPGDKPGVLDQHIRAAGHLQAWLSLGILVQDATPAFYVSEQEFVDSHGETHCRQGIFARIPARPWKSAEILPHERTFRGPKEERLALMRATKMQTSAVFGLWDRAANLENVLAAATKAAPLLDGKNQGELGSETHRLWAITEAKLIAAIHEALLPAQLFIADGHHRYETAVAYADEQKGEPESQWVLVYLASAESFVGEIFPTHRLVHLPNTSTLDWQQFSEKITGKFTVQKVESWQQALALAANPTDNENVFAVATKDSAGIVRKLCQQNLSPAKRLDVAILQDQVILATLGLSPEAISSGALSYTRDAKEVWQTVQNQQATIGFVCNPTNIEDLLAVAKAGEIMPQKSTYFYPKVPTGLVMSPLAPVMFP